MIQRHNSNIQNNSSNNSSNFNIINATELEQHIMNGLNMKRKPDANLASISQEEFFTKYNEYLSKVNYRIKRSAKLYGDDITNIVFDDDNEFKKIFAFKHSNQSNVLGSQRKRRSTREEDITSLAFEIEDKSDLPTVIEQATLSIFLTNDYDHATSTHPPATETESHLEYDDSSSSGSDLSPKKLTIKPNSKSHHLRHHNHHHRNKIHINKNSQAILKLHVYQTNSHEGRTFLFTKDLTISPNSDDTHIAFSKWIQLDLTSVVRTWLQGNEKTFNIDIYCEMCSKYGISIINEGTSQNNNGNPALNVIGAIVRTKRKIQNRKKKGDGKKQNQKHKKTHCRHNGESKCCRHEWTIDFKELGGYDYIISPRHFDAGYCDGMCPFRHNMGSNHAYFQSLAHHQLKKENVPNVCCAPTKLQDLEVLHIDENDHTKLKVTTMKKMMAMKCSCT
ncbi:hypothetical protein PVAND_000497 [Polypedilum vanderplanki]|uniref:TGF-beta family profile domain-containing protein n=1 Tax=Polypedilum vanderplanki TaxID=319348 RepID=A0A9J6BL54_POLVA|nr:hypothetical protein PVAND_000497 [Polypedilum vanderplanki]